MIPYLPGGMHHNHNRSRQPRLPKSTQYQKIKFRVRVNKLMFWELLWFIWQSALLHARIIHVLRWLVSLMFNILRRGKLIFLMFKTKPLLAFNLEEYAAMMAMVSDAHIPDVQDRPLDWQVWECYYNVQIVWSIPQLPQCHPLSAAILETLESTWKQQRDILRHTTQLQPSHSLRPQNNANNWL